MNHKEEQPIVSDSYQFTLLQNAPEVIPINDDVDEKEHKYDPEQQNYREAMFPEARQGNSCLEVPKLIIDVGISLSLVQTPNF